MKNQLKNPFTVQTPESMDANDVIDLFVDVFSEYHNIPMQGHTFINGPRGSGKSMMFRYMMPDCQKLALKRDIDKIKYFSLYIPIKRTAFNRTDLDFLENQHSTFLLNEHFMVTQISMFIFDTLSETDFINKKGSSVLLKEFYENFFITKLTRSGWKFKDIKLPNFNRINDVFSSMNTIFGNIYESFVLDYLNKLATKSLIYKGPIISYIDFLLPLLKELKKLPFMPKGPFFLLIDDADNLNLPQTKILNTWVSYRTSAFISLKISTQLKYKTYQTINDSRIDTPHDFNVINITDKYTTSGKSYSLRVKKAVEKRLKKVGLSNITAESYFPPDKKQEDKIKIIFKDYKTQYGYDYAYRYSRPDFMKGLKGNLNTYSYAGFNQLVDVSSGIIRDFLDVASKMFNMMYSKKNTKSFKFIEDGIQDDAIKIKSNEFLYDEFEKFTEEQGVDKIFVSKTVKLRNLIEALGQTFNLILFSKSTERRVFSFALEDEPDEELSSILKLGVELGYFHRTLIGNKLGTGKARLYILSRLLAPYYKLDPTSFAGYKFVTNDILKRAINNPKTFVGRIKNLGIDKVLDDPQGNLFEENEN